MTVFDNDTEVGSRTGLKSKNNFSVPLAAVTGAHELRCEMTDGAVTVSRSMTVNVLPDTRPVLQKLYVNGTDVTDGTTPLTYDTRNSRFDVQATYTHPERIEKLWLVAETTAENYYLELTWDERTSSFKGNGVLGSLHEPVYSVWLSMVEKWDPDTVMDYVTYDDSLFTDVLYFNETNLVPMSVDPLQEQALADWETYTDFINRYHNSGDEEAILAALRELFGDDNAWYTPAIYLADGTVWRQAFRYDPAAVEAAMSSPSAVTININGDDVKSAMAVDPDEEIVYFAGCAGSMLPPVLRTESPRRLLKMNNLAAPSNPSKVMDFVSVGSALKAGYDWGVPAWDIAEHWDDPINDDTADDWIRRVGSIPGAPPGAGDVGAGIHDMLKKRRDDADRARKGLPPRSPDGPGGPTAPLIDPSGYIYDAVESNRIEGVSASLYYKDGGEWIAWDSEAYGQSANPMRSLTGGAYGWDVLPGTWKVVFEKDGYVTTESEELPVPPPHLDVNISLVSEAAPQVQSVTANDDGSAFALTFDRYMKVSELTAPGAVSFTVGGAPLTGTLTAVNAEAVRTGNKQAVGNAGLTADEQAATKFTFTPTEPVAPGTAVSVSVPTSVHAYNGKTLAAAYSTSVTVPGSSGPGAWAGVVETSKKDPEMSSLFTDVSAGDYYCDAVEWAAKNGIINGTGESTFSPAAPVTRGQVVTMLWRAAGCPEPKGDAGRFADVVVGSYYEKAVAWAVEQGVTNGTGETTFSPNTACTRGQIVTFLARFAGAENTDAASGFTDVAADDYFAAAVRWAKSAGVTEGTSATTFSPDAACTRAQSVTFLWRWMVR